MARLLHDRFSGVESWGKKSNFLHAELVGKKEHKDWSKGSNCIETNCALKAVASLGPYARLFRSCPGTYVVRPQHRRRVIVSMIVRRLMFCTNNCIVISYAVTFCYSRKILE